MNKTHKKHARVVGIVRIVHLALREVISAADVAPDRPADLRAWVRAKLNEILTRKS